MSAVLALAREEFTLWYIALGMGLVVVLVVILLLTFLVLLVRDIDIGVYEAAGIAAGAASNTEALERLAITASALEQIKQEALRHDALLARKL